MGRVETGRWPGPLGAGILETTGVVLAFVGFGLLWAALEARALGNQPPYPGATVAPDPDPPVIWLVDGFNVLHASVLYGRDRADWWSEPRRAELLARARRFDDPGAEIWVVFDGPRPEVPPASGGVHTVFAPSADDWLVARVRTLAGSSRVAVVTSDRRLAGRSRHCGARVLAPGEFLARCGSDL